MADDDDARDERMHELLEVEPLDELTRRRLVTTAVRASAPPARSRRWIAVAAVVAALVVAGGVTLIALGGGGDSSAPTALNGRPGNTSAAAPEHAPAAAVPADAGDFGDLAVADNLARARRELGAVSSFDHAPAAADRAGSASASASDGASLAARLGALSCAAELPEGTVVALGTGTFGRRAAIVVATDRPDGTRSVDAVLSDPCEVRPLD
ncbi:MAG TPA: hypothetical protein VH986_11550 [Acidimicrobiia bacterium]